MSFRNRFLRKTVVCILGLVLALAAVCPVTARASEPRTIRVGYFAFPGYHEVTRNENGLQGSGYGFDFLQLLRRYTNLNFQYVGYGDSWQDMQQMLRSGEIDLLTSARKTSQREKEFAFSSSIGTSNAELLVRPGDSRFELNDYQSFDGMTIGLLKGNSRNDDLAELALEKGFTYHTRIYEEEAELTTALEMGDVDGIVTSSLRKSEGEKVVARFALEEFYAIVRKEDTALLEEINRGIAQMDQNEGDWRNLLFYKYTIGSQDSALSFTPEELAYIQAVQSGEITITASAQPDRDPYSYVENGTLVGIIPDYFDHLMGMAGLPYTVLAAESREQYYDWVRSNKVDVYMDINPQRTNLMLQGSGIATDPYLSLTTSRVTKKDFQGKIRTIAVTYNQIHDEIHSDLDMAENVRTIAYDTRKQALEAVKNGAVDACFVYTYMAEKFVNQDPDGELIFHIVNLPATELAMMIRPTTDHALISILNKCLKADGSPVLDELVESSTRFQQPEVTFGRFVRKNPGFGVALVTIVVSVAAVIFLILRNSRNMRAVAEERTAMAESLREKNRLLEESARQAQSANIAKTTFLNNMSHDIRTPMNAIIGFTNIALKQPVEQEVRNCLEKIRDSSEHLLTLINDVLDISRIESGKMTYEPVPVDMTKVIDTVLDIMGGFLMNRDLTFTAIRADLKNPYVLADPLRIREVLVNILGNAVKFTNDGGSIRFEEDYRPGEDDRHLVACFRITDTGVGMSEEFLGRIFEDFAQEENGARTQYQGTGLGMSITGKYVEMMGGTIRVESKKGSGSSFTVELPLERSDREQVFGQQSPQGQNRLNGVRVLLAEDNDLNAEIATLQLEEYGVEVVRAMDGKEAVERFADNPAGYFHVILMDVMMPRMNGYQATRAIRSLGGRPDGARIPILAMTANAFAEDVQASLDAGMNGHLSKPIVMEEVIKAITRNLK